MLKFLLAAAVALLVARPAYAYIDPGSGSMLLQLLLGGVAGLLVAFKLMRNRIAGIFRRRRPEDDQPRS